MYVCNPGYINTLHIQVFFVCFFVSTPHRGPDRLLVHVLATETARNTMQMKANVKVND